MSNNQLVISNFRSWRHKNYIDLASINLLLGANSSGKSSIIHALSLLKQSELAHRLIPKATEIDLGRIEDQVNFNSKKKSERTLDDYIGFGLKYQIQGIDLLRTTSRVVNRGNPGAGKPARSAREQHSKDLAALLGDLEYIERFDDVGFLKQITLSARKQQLIDIHIKKLRPSKLSITIDVTDELDYWEQFIDFTPKIAQEEFGYQELKRNKEDYIKDRKEELKERVLLQSRLANELKKIQLSASNDKNKEDQNDIAALNRRYNDVEFENSRLKNRIRMEEEELKITSIPGKNKKDKCSYLSVALSQSFTISAEELDEEGLVEFLITSLGRPYRHLFQQSPTVFHQIAATLTMLDKNSKNQLNPHPFLLLEIVHNRFRQIIGSVVRIGPHRERPDRVTFVNPNDKSTFVGSQGENVMSIIHQSSPEKLKELNQWFELLGIPYGIKKKFNKQFNISQLILTDNQGMSVSLADVGYGISQVLPIVITSVLSKNTIITIEQPELHLHPKLQANLADLFIKSASTRNNNFILETHSEHIILRLKRRQKEAPKKIEKSEPVEKMTFGDSLPTRRGGPRRRFLGYDRLGLAKWISIRNSVMISVIDTPKNKSESKFSKITLNSDGEFDNIWPGDFFPERYDELGLGEDF